MVKTAIFLKLRRFCRVALVRVLVAKSVFLEQTAFRRQAKGIVIAE
jgi:hypothetical protein